MKPTWAINWHHDLWSWMTLSCPTLMSPKFEVKHFKNCDRSDVRANKSPIRSHSWAIDWHNDLWPWMTLNCPSSRSSKVQVKYFKTVTDTMLGVNRSWIGSRPWAIDWHHHLCLGWPWNVLGHITSASDISNTMRVTMIDTMEFRKETMNGLSKHHDLWHWMTLNSPSSSHHNCTSNI